MYRLEKGNEGVGVYSLPNACFWEIRSRKNELHSWRARKQGEGKRFLTFQPQLSFLLKAFYEEQRLGSWLVANRRPRRNLSQCMLAHLRTAACVVTQRVGWLRQSLQGVPWISGRCGGNTVAVFNIWPGKNRRALSRALFLKIQACTSGIQTQEG